MPPTVERSEGPLGPGSLQQFVDADFEQHYFTLLEDDRHHPVLKRMAAFDYLANNADRKGGHCLLDAEGRVWGIDHGLCFHTQPKLRTVIWDFAGEPWPRKIWKTSSGSDGMGFPTACCPPSTPKSAAPWSPGCAGCSATAGYPSRGATTLIPGPWYEPSRSAPLLEGLDQLGQHLVDVAHHSEVGDGEDGGFLILVDGDDVLGALHTDHVLGGP